MDEVQMPFQNGLGLHPTPAQKQMGEMVQTNRTTTTELHRQWDLLHRQWSAGG